MRLEALQCHPEAFGESWEALRRLDQAWWDVYSNQAAIFAYILPDALVGIVGVSSQKEEKIRHKAHLSGLYVKEKYRRQGVADTLLRQAIEYASLDHRQLCLTVTVSNVPAIALYKKHKFIIYGTEPQALMVNNQFYDEHLMSRQL